MAPKSIAEIWIPEPGFVTFQSGNEINSPIVRQRM